MWTIPATGSKLSVVATPLDWPLNGTWFPAAAGPASTAAKNIAAIGRWMLVFMMVFNIVFPFVNSSVFIGSPLSLSGGRSTLIFREFVSIPVVAP